MIAAVVFLFGIIFGSFFNVCIDRIPEQKSIVAPPSHCNSCGHNLSTMDLIPVFSYLYLKGKCRYCGSKIGIWDLISELSVGILFLLACLRFGLSLQLLPALVLMSILYIVSVIDYKHQIIPDGPVITGLTAAIIFIISGITVNWLEGLIGLVIGGGFFLTVAVLSELVLKKDGIGGGDIKLMAMIGAFLGWKLTLVALLLSIYTGGIIGGILMVSGIKKKGDHIPFGPFISLGAAVALFFGNNIVEWYVYNIIFY